MEGRQKVLRKDMKPALLILAVVCSTQKILTVLGSFSSRWPLPQNTLQLNKRKRGKETKKAKSWLSTSNEQTAATRGFSLRRRGGYTYPNFPSFVFLLSFEHCRKSFSYENLSCFCFWFFFLLRSPRFQAFLPCGHRRLPNRFQESRTLKAFLFVIHHFFPLPHKRINTMLFVLYTEGVIKHEMTSTLTQTILNSTKCRRGRRVHEYR